MNKSEWDTEVEKLGAVAQLDTETSRILAETMYNKALEVLSELYSGSLRREQAVIEVVNITQACFAIMNTRYSAHETVVAAVAVLKNTESMLSRTIPAMYGLGAAEALAAANELVDNLFGACTSDDETLDILKDGIKKAKEKKSANSHRQEGNGEASESGS